jgi:hypothetical protein
MPGAVWTTKLLGPFCVKPGTVELDVPRPLCDLAGIYFWTVEFDGGYLVNYVGKTIRPYSARFRDYKKWYEDGKDILDPEFMPKGENWLVVNPSREQVLLCLATFRVFLAPFDVKDDALLQIEGGLIEMFDSAEEKCRNFFGNKQRRKRSKTGDRVVFNADALLHGLKAELDI